MKTLVLIIALTCSSIAQRELLDRGELLQAVSGSGDLAEWTAKNGVDLPKLVENCLDGTNTADQFRAWKLLVYFLHSYGADGAAGEDLSTVGPSLSKLIDDTALLRIVAEIPEKHWDSIPFSLDWRFNYQALSDAEKSRLQKAHSTAVRAIKREIERALRRTHQAEQGGADQPATAPESKSEDSEKPKRESRVRPK
ncbi:MAG TPA: hypothetical protein QGF50_06145 [Roseibacillus sp.]|jgi:hypothetical protein|nr:hypothetical protein [Roseibacillus sp.]|tara:strand:+ start:251 stop:838 length:588 start_codon:yes stop_codon:yes gene_type:complete